MNRSKLFHLLLFISMSYSQFQYAEIKPYYNVLEFGAKANGETLDTKAIQNAIDECSNNGGGTVEFMLLIFEM